MRLSRISLAARQGRGIRRRATGVVIDTDAAAGSGIHGLDAAARIAPAGDSLKGAMMGLAVDEEGSRDLRCGRDYGVRPDRPVDGTGCRIHRPTEMVFRPGPGMRSRHPGRRSLSRSGQSRIRQSSADCPCRAWPCRFPPGHVGAKALERSLKIGLQCFHSLLQNGNPFRQFMTRVFSHAPIISHRYQDFQAAAAPAWRFRRSCRALTPEFH